MLINVMLIKEKTCTSFGKVNGAVFVLDRVVTSCQINEEREVSA